MSAPPTAAASSAAPAAAAAAADNTNLPGAGNADGEKPSPTTAASPRAKDGSKLGDPIPVEGGHGRDTAVGSAGAESAGDPGKEVWRGCPLRMACVVGVGVIARDSLSLSLSLGSVENTEKTRAHSRAGGTELTGPKGHSRPHPNTIPYAYKQHVLKWSTAVESWAVV